MARAPQFNFEESVQVKSSMLNAVTSDVHFWVPVVVLIAGLALLLVLGR
jgi:hypothetical protein